jgi:hypothetical protein
MVSLPWVERRREGPATVKGDDSEKSLVGRTTEARRE